MTTPPVLFDTSTDFVLKVKDTTLQPDYQQAKTRAEQARPVSFEVQTKRPGVAGTTRGMATGSES